jgi:hypothetical protein
MQIGLQASKADLNISILFMVAKPLTPNRQFTIQTPVTPQHQTNRYTDNSTYQMRPLHPSNAVGSLQQSQRNAPSSGSRSGVGNRWIFGVGGGARGTSSSKRLLRAISAWHSVLVPAQALVLVDDDIPRRAYDRLLEAGEGPLR